MDDGTRTGDGTDEDIQDEENDPKSSKSISVDIQGDDDHFYYEFD